MRHQSDVSTDDYIELRYDADTIAAAQRLAEAEAAMEPVRGTPRAYGTFKRYLRYANLVDRQAAGLHYTHRTSRLGCHCTCGLITPDRLANALTAPGHLNTVTGELARVVVGTPTPGHRQHPRWQPAPDFIWRRWVAHCTDCHWQSTPAPLETARLHATYHPLSAPPGLQDPTPS